MNSALQKLYEYHAWANSDLLKKLGESHAEIDKSALHTVARLLNHYYVVAQIFKAHLSGVQHCYTSDNTVETPSLLEIQESIVSCDRWYLDYIRGAKEAPLHQRVSFTFTDGDLGQMSKEEILTHVALHGVYHRGEVGRLLWQQNITPPWDTFAVFLHRDEPQRREQT